MLEKVHWVHSVWNQYAPNIIHSKLSGNKQYNNITLSDATTKLLDLLLAMTDCDQFSKFLKNLKDVNATVPLDSPFWQGYTILHLSILMTENMKLWDHFFSKSDSQQQIDTLFQKNQETTVDDNYSRRVEICLEEGCSVISRNPNGITPIHLAFKMHKPKITNLLLNRCSENSVGSNELSFFHIACVTGNVEVVKRLLDLGVNINSQTTVTFEWFFVPQDNYTRRPRPYNITVPINSTALHLAVNFQIHNKTLIELLLDMGGDVYSQNELGLTPIHLSLVADKSIAELILKKASNLNESLTSYGLSYLHVAAYADDADVIEKLLEMGSNIDTVFNQTGPEVSFFAPYNKCTPLYVAILAQSINAIASLIKNGANIFQQSPKIETPLQSLLRDFCDEPAIRSSIENKLRHDQRFKEAIDANGMTLLFVACCMFDIDWAKELLEKGADVNAQITDDYEDDTKGSTPLHYLIGTIAHCIDEDREKINAFVKLMIEFGANLLTVNHNDHSPLLLAHNLCCYAYLEEEYAIDNQFGEVLLPIADLLLENQLSYEVNPVLHSTGFSHFHYACMRNKVDIVRKFLDNGIYVNHKASVTIGGQIASNFTPLHFAVYYRSKEVAYLLIERGAKVTAVNGDYETPLHIALIRKLIDYRLFEMLLRNGADINARNSFTMSPIDCFIERNNEITFEQLKFLLNHGSVLTMELKEYEGIFGLAMKNAKPCDRELILEELINFFDLKNNRNNSYTPIENIVCVYQDGRLTIDFYLNVIQKFIDMGYNLDEQNGETALHTAIYFDNLEAVEALLLLGADMNIISIHNESPFGISYIFGRSNLIAKMFAAHIWKTKNVGLRVHKILEAAMLEFHKKFPLDVDLPRQCKDELIKLSEENMGELLTIRCFLYQWGAAMYYPTMSLIQRQNVDKFFANFADMRKHFPHFCGLLMMQYRKARDRFKLHKIAINLLPSVLLVEYFPYLCLENILKYFDNDELYYFIKGQCPGRKILVQSPNNDGNGRNYSRVTL